jgi:preprotein translocase subunit YajC
MLLALLLAAAEQEPTTPGWAQFLPLILIAVAFYFLLIMPMRRQEKQRQAMIAAIKKNDRVVTSGGLIGIVVSIKDKEDEATLKVDETSNVRLKVTKSSIVRVLSSAGGEEAPKENKDDKDSDQS